jgi:peptide deformylase
MMINPEILELSSDAELWEEGCLSLPWFRIDVPRSHSIKVQFTDERGKEKILFLEWFPARIVQHEIDHLEWILIVDKT